jgi:type IV pilus assembly protein PilF
MSKSVNDLWSVRLRPSVTGAVCALLLAACVHTTPHQAPPDPKNAAIANLQLGSAYMNQGELQLAKDKLDKALTQDPNNPEVHSVRAMLFERMGQPAKADAEYRTALRLAPNDPNVINNYAVYLCQNGRTDEGVKHFLLAAKNALYRTPEAAYTNAGVCLRAAKPPRDEEARGDFVKALQLRPDFADAAYQLADLEFQHGELPQSRALLDAYLANFRETPDILLLAVRVARAQNDRVGAQRYARKLQVDFPGSDQVRALAGLDHNPG